MEHSKKVWTSAPPLGLAYLASVLRENDHEVEIIDLSHSYANFSDFLDHLKLINPDIIGITIASALYQTTIPIIKKINSRCKDSFIVAGGPHPTAVKEEILEEVPEIDALVVGEGDFTLSELANNLENRNFSKIDGLIYRENNKIIVNKPRSLIKNLDKLPFPARDLLPMEKYKFLSIMTSRGCPHRCIYCDKSVFGRKFRARSPENVVDELELLTKQYPNKTDRVDISDDAFNIDMNRAKEICDMIIDRKLDITFTFGNGIRADRVDKELLQKLKKAGCVGINYGIECPNDKILKNIGKNLTIEKIKNAVKLTKEVGIFVGGFFIVDLPGTTYKLVQENIRFMNEIKLDYHQFAFATPYPNTRMYEYVKNTPGVRILSEDLAKDKDLPFFETTEFSSEEKVQAFNDMLKARNKLMLKKYLSVSQTIKDIKKVKNPLRIVNRINHILKLLINNKHRGML